MPAQSVAIPHKWPLVQQPSNRSSSYLKDARLVNGYAEKNNEGEWEVKKRFGLGVYPVTGFPTNGQGMFYWTANQGTIVVSGGNAYAINYVGLPIPSLQKSLLGTISVSTVRSCSFCIVPAALPYLVLSTSYGDAGYYLQNGGVLTKITDPNYPFDTVPGIVYLDGTTYVMDSSAGIWASQNLNDPTVWSGNVIYANSESDQAIALAKQLVYVIAFKSTSTQVFYDAGNATGSPLSQVQGALIPYGCFSAQTIQEIDSTLLWVTNSKIQAKQIIRLDNLAPRIISTPAIERFLDLSTSLYSDYLRSFSIKHAGHKFYGVTNLITNITLVYDLDQELWYQWTNSDGTYFSQAGITVDPQYNLICQDITTGVVSYIDADYVYPNDNGVAVPLDIYTPRFTAGTSRRKTLNMMYFNADQVNGSLQARYSDDDYQSWSNFRSIDLGVEKPMLDQEGTFTNRAYHFRYSGNTQFRISSGELQMDVGTL